MPFLKSGEPKADQGIILVIWVLILVYWVPILVRSVPILVHWVLGYLVLSSQGWAEQAWEKEALMT